MTSHETLKFPIIQPHQGSGIEVFCFVANANQIGRMARIERVGRSSQGELTGFQRPQISSHIREIREYFEQDDAVLANPLVLGFTNGARIKREKEGLILHVDVASGPIGWIVDGQQRYTALRESGKQFEVIVSGFICPSIEELKKQFILINNTKPLPKSLIYELLPQIEHLPVRMSRRAKASLITEMLNYQDTSSLKGLIKQQTNPSGIIADTIIQKIFLNSVNDGALRLFAREPALLIQNGFELISEFFYAVQHVFRDAWDGQDRTTSRLLHGTGLIAMGYAMETLVTMTGARDRRQFADGLRHLLGHTAWTSGQWHIDGEVRNWNSLQNVAVDVRALSLYLSQIIKKGINRERAIQNEKRDASTFEFALGEGRV